MDNKSCGDDIGKVIWSRRAMNQEEANKDVADEVSDEVDFRGEVIETITIGNF